MGKKSRRKGILFLFIFMAIVLIIKLMTTYISSRSISSPERETYTVEVVKSGVGKVYVKDSKGKEYIERNGKLQVPCGDNIEFFAKAGKNHRITLLSINDEIRESAYQKNSYSEEGFYDQTYNKIVVDFQEHYELKFSSSGDADIIVNDRNYTTENMPSEYALTKGSTLSLKVVPKEKYQITSIIINGNTIEGDNLTEVLSKSGEYILRDEGVASQYDIYIKMEKKKYVIRYEYNSGGYLMVDGNKVDTPPEASEDKRVGELIVEEGSNHTLELVTVDPFYYIKSINVDGEEKYSVDDYGEQKQEIDVNNVSSNVIVEAYFNELEQITNKSIIQINYKESTLVEHIEKENKYVFINSINNEVDFGCYNDDWKLQYIVLEDNRIVSISEKINESKRIKGFIIKNKENKWYALKNNYILVYDKVNPSIQKVGVKYFSQSIKKICVSAYDEGESGLFQLAFGNMEAIRKWSDDDKTDVLLGDLQGKGEYFVSIPSNTNIKEKFFLQVKDYAGNVSKPHPIDLTPPTITASTSSSWSHTTAKIIGTAKDDASKVTAVYYSMDKADFEQHLEDGIPPGSKGIKKADLNTKTGKFDITIKSMESNKSLCYIWAYDSTGNKSFEPQVIQINIDNEAPVVSLVSKTPDSTWTNQSVVMEVKAVDDGKISSGLKEVYYATDETLQDATRVDLKYLENDSFVVVTPRDSSGNPIPWSGIYYFGATDCAGNKSKPVKVNVNIDTDVPKMEFARLYHLQDGKVEEIQQTYANGTYSNSQVQIQCKASDSGYASGVKEISLLKDGKILDTQKTDVDGNLNFTIQAPLEGELSFLATDHVNNKSEIKMLNELNGSLKSSNIVLENTKPSITLTTEEEPYVNKQGDKWYNRDVTYKIQVKEVKSGIASIKVKINDRTMEKDSQSKKIQVNNTKEPILQQEYQISTALAQPRDDGSYEIEVLVQDAAGNSNSVMEKIFIDCTRPYVEKFILQEKHVTEDKQEEKQDKKEDKEAFRYFSAEEKIVTLEAMDVAATAGIDTIRYYLIDYSKGKEGQASPEITKKVDKRNQITCKVPVDFKGYLYAVAEDNVGNVSATYKQSVGIVTESEEGHKNTSEIQIVLPEINTLDAKGNALYQQDVPVTIIAKDSLSGLQEVEWNVIDAKDTSRNQSGKIVVDDMGALSGDVETVEGIEKEKNLVLQIKGKLLVTNNSNNIVIQVKLKDHVGHVSEKQVVLSIDKTKPVITFALEKTNQNENTVQQRQYKEPRKVVVTVTERNFNPSLAKVMITNEYGEVPNLSEWVAYTNEASPDQTTYQSTLLFTQDGKYTIQAEALDAAGNVAESQQMVPFIIDLTNPIIEVELSNKNVKNGMYYQESLVATITVVEKNFSKEMFKITGTATRAKKEVTYPQYEEVSSRDDVHVYKVVFDKDAVYTLNVACEDTVGNVSTSMETITFVVDKERPKVIIDGIRDKKAYKGEVIPSITYTDCNLDLEEVSIQILGANQGDLVLDGKINAIQDGEKVIYDCFPNRKEVDDLYIMKVRITDLAGNETMVQYSFSVNRFGSVYSFGESLREIEGTYIQNEQDILITETNVNGLDPEEILIKVIKNGMPLNLEEGMDYTIHVLGGDTSWTQYQYAIKKEVFKEEGKYIVTIYSEDMAGNINENIVESKSAEIWFGVDKTEPVITPINFSSGKTYGEESKQISLMISDNLVLHSVQILLNGKEVEYEVKEDSYFFQIPSSNSSQTLLVIAKDTAGNEARKEIEGFYVTTNLVIRIRNNRSLILGSFGGVGGGLLLGAFVLFRKREKSEIKNKE